jgi:outer membrane immunogenic protein
MITRRARALAIGLLAVAAGPAAAADIGAPPPIARAPAIAPPPVNSWTGCYIGGHGGGAFVNVSRAWTVTDHYQFAGSAFDTDLTTFTAGGQLGCQWQLNQWVVGLEGGGSFVGKDNTVHRSPFLSPVGSDPVFVGNNIESVLFAVGRVGYLFTPQLLVYAKGGYANVGVQSHIQDSLNAAGTLLHFSDSTVRHGGWIAGAGIDWLFARDWIIGVDYSFIHTETGTHTGSVGGVAPAPPLLYQTDINADLHMVVARISYLFHWGGRP